MYYKYSTFCIQYIFENIIKMNEIPNYSGILEMFFNVEKEKNKFGRQYNFFKTEKKKILKGIVKRYKLDEEYGVTIIKTFGKMTLDYFNPVVSTNIIKIVCCLGGECKFYSSEYKRSFTLEKGDIIMYRMNNKIKKYKFESNNLETITVNLNLDKLKKNLSKLTDEIIIAEWNKNISVLLDENLFYYAKNNSEINTISKFIHKMSIQNISDYLMFKMKVFNLLFVILELQIKENKNKKHNLTEIEIVEKIKKQLEKYEITEIPTTRNLCKTMNFTNHQIQSSFKKVLGMSLAKFIQKIKMEEAKKLLEEGQKNIIEISYDVGYDSPSKFSKAFKKYFGILPREYKKINT